MSINNNSSSNKEEPEEERKERERLEYNQYVLSDGIHEKVRSIIDKKFQVRVLDKVYTRTRQRIREKGGMISHDAAMKWVTTTQGREIIEEIYNETLDGIAESYPLLAENMRLDKDEKTREEARRMYFDIMKAFE